MHHGRRIPRIAAVMQLPIALQAGLTRPEGCPLLFSSSLIPPFHYWSTVISLILYTGPMFVVYNSILRRSPPETFSKFSRNMFSTTIFVLVSAVQKISTRTPLPLGTKLYRSNFAVRAILVVGDSLSGGLVAGCNCPGLSSHLMNAAVLVLQSNHACLSQSRRNLKNHDCLLADGDFCLQRQIWMLLFSTVDLTKRHLCLPLW
jgi:hypothetical protein